MWQGKCPYKYFKLGSHERPYILCFFLIKPHLCFFFFFLKKPCIFAEKNP